MSAKKSPLHTLAQQIVEKLSASGRYPDLDKSTCHHLLHAAIGSISPEIATEKKVPIQVFTGPDSRQYNLYATILRAQKRLDVSYVQAVGVAEEIIEALRDAKIGVNQVQLLLDPSFSKEVKAQVFKGLRKNLELNDDGIELKPQTATLAIAAKLIPRPKIAWKDRFSLATAFPSRGQSQLIEHVTKNECYLWAFPPTHDQATAPATIDTYGGDHPRTSAEMGMGFSIIQAGWAPPRPSWQQVTYTQYAIFTPIWLWRASNDEWKVGNIIRTEIRDGAPWSKERLADFLPKGLTSLPRIHGCPICRMLFIDKTPGYPDVPTQCMCVEESGGTI